MGPVLLASAMWIDDDELIEKLMELSGACVVFTKQSRRPRKRQDLERLRTVNEQTPGLPMRAFPELGGLAPKVDAQAAVIGPYDRMDEGVVCTFRTLGYRRRQDFPPILHAKLALLGRLWWHDEDALGYPEDVIGFTRQRLWISSANFTRSSRHNLEFGYWTEDAALLQGAESFLVSLMRDSEDVDPDADAPDPTLAPVAFDDDAIAEALGDADWDDADGSN